MTAKMVKTVINLSIKTVMTNQSSVNLVREASLLNVRAIKRLMLWLINKSIKEKTIWIIVI